MESLTADTSGTFTDVLPSAKTWASLDASDSAKYIALGVGITDNSGWNSGYSTDTDWAASKSAAQLGTLASSATGNADLTADFGRAISTTQTPTGSIVFSFSLA